MIPRSIVYVSDLVPDIRRALQRRGFLRVVRVVPGGIYLERGPA